MQLLHLVALLLLQTLLQRLLRFALPLLLVQCFAHHQPQQEVGTAGEAGALSAVPMAAEKSVLTQRGEAGALPAVPMGAETVVLTQGGESGALLAVQMAEGRVLVQGRRAGWWCWGWGLVV